MRGTACLSSLFFAWTDFGFGRNHFCRLCGMTQTKFLSDGWTYDGAMPLKV